MSASYLNSDLQIYAIAALKDNYIWLIVNSRGGAVVVDPGDAAPVLDYLVQYDLKLQGILITHHHWDHTNGIAELLQHYPVPVFGSQLNVCSELSHKVEEGQIVEFNAHFPSYQVLAIPGHTLDHIAYYANDHLFCGDTLFAGGCGRLFEGTPEQMYTSLQKIAAFPDHTKLYCAHEYTLANLQFAQLVESNNLFILERIEKVKAMRQQNQPSIPSLLSEEKQTNPFLRCTQPEVKQQAEQYMRRYLSDPIEVFAALRAWKNTQ